MYEQYLQLSSIPCDAVLDRIMSKEGYYRDERGYVLTNSFSRFYLHLTLVTEYQQDRVCR